MQLAQKIVLPSFTVEGPLPTIAGGGYKFPNLASVVSEALKYIFPVAGILLFLYLIWGGFDYLVSMGDPKKAEAGKNKITHAVIGFLIIFAAFFIVQITDYVFHLGVYTPNVTPTPTPP
jgi:hypothetical protein